VDTFQGKAFSGIVMGIISAEQRSFLAVVLCLLGSASAQTQIDDLGRLQIADEPTTPRLSAMGGVGTAIPGGGFAFYNAASPAFAELPFISVEYGSLPGDDNTGDLTKGKLEAAWMFKKWFAGVSLTTWSTEYLTSTEQGIGPAASWQLLQASLTGGFKIGRFAMGNCFDFYQDRMGDVVNDQAVTYSPGFLFQIVPGKVTLGGSLRNYVRLDTSLARFAWFGGAISLPRYVRAGAAWTDTLKSAAMPFTASADIVYSAVYQRFMMPVGIEAWILPCLAARLGVPIHDPSNIVHFGVGLRINSITCDFDYGVTQPALIPGASLEQKWLLGLSYALHIPHAVEKQLAGNTPASQPQILKPNSASDSSVIAVPILTH